ncbi:MAG: 2-dehydropantoate 2-reductase [Terriglobales bacterium]
MRHAILGAGGVGGLIGACLAKSGDSVTLVVRSEVLGSYPKQVYLESPFGNITVSVELSSTVPAADVVWITVKATQLSSALMSFSENASVRAIVPLLNGIDHVPLLREKYGVNRVIPATIGVESERVSPGHFVHRSPFARLNISSQGREVLKDSVARLEQLGFTCQFVDNEPTLLWRKLVFLAPLALVSTATGKSTGEMVADPTSWQQIQDCVREACTAARAEKAEVDAEAVIAMIRTIPGHMRSSMQKDVKQHKQPELDAIAGPILRGAARHGFDVPVTRKLVAEIEEKVAQYK